MTRLGAVPQEARARARLIPLRGAHYPWPSPIIPGRTGNVPWFCLDVPTRCCPAGVLGTRGLNPLRAPSFLGRTRIIPRWDAGTLGLSPREPLSESLRGGWFFLGKLKIVVDKLPFHILHIRGRLVG